MRRLLPFALLLVACAKPSETAPVAAAPAATPAPSADLTPEGMAKSMDVPLYPGATAPDGLSDAPQRRDDGSTHYDLVLATGDAPEKALAWYAKALNLPLLHGSIFGKSKRGNDVSVVARKEAGRTLVRIKSIAYAP